MNIVVKAAIIFSKHFNVLEITAQICIAQAVMLKSRIKFFQLLHQLELRIQELLIFLRAAELAVLLELHEVGPEVLLFTIPHYTD